MPKSPTCNLATDKTINNGFDVDDMVRGAVTDKAWDYFTKLGPDDTKGHMHNKRLLEFEAIVSLKAMFVWHNIVLPACDFQDLEILHKNAASQLFAKSLIMIGTVPSSRQKWSLRFAVTKPRRWKELVEGKPRVIPFVAVHF